MLRMQQERSRLFYAVLALPCTAMGFALSVQIAALSWILSTKFELAIHDIGLVWAAGPIAGIFGQVIIGTLSDRVWFWNGRRRPFIVIGGTIAALMLLALPNIDVISSALGFDGVLGVALVVVLTLDFSINVSFNPTRSIIADVTPDGNERTKGYTWMQTVSGTFGTGAYAIGAFFDNYTLIYVGVVLVLLFSVIPPLFIEEPRSLREKQALPDAARNKTGPGGMLLAIQPLWGFLIYDIYAMTLRIARVEYQHYYAEMICAALTIFLVIRSLFASSSDKLTAFRKVLAAHSFSWIGIHTTFVYMVIYLQSALPNLDDVQIGQTMAMSMLILNAVGAILPVLVLEPLSARIGRVNTHAGSLAVMAAGYILLTFYGSTAMAVYVLMAVIGVGWASMISLPFAIMSQQTEKSEMGLFMGLFNLSIVLPQLVVSLGIGLAVSRADDMRIIFVISAVALLLSTMSWMRIREE